MPSKVREPHFRKEQLEVGLTEWARDVADLLNGVAEGSIDSQVSALTAQPTGAILKPGDFIRAAVPTVTATLSGTHILAGWIVTVEGSASPTTSRALWIRTE